MIVQRLYSNDNKINEERYYSHSSADFNRTAGAKDQKAKGLFKALPIFALSALVCWPLALLAGIGALSYRIQKRWEDKDAKRQMLRPAYWTDYLANRHDDKHDDDFKNKSTMDKVRDVWGIKQEKDTDTSNTSNNTDNRSSDERGLLADTMDNTEELTPEERKSQDFKTYWVKFSNNEIVRLRATNEQEAKQFANMIVKETVKPVYEILNARISQANQPKFIFYLDTGEIIYWSHEDKKKAFKEAINTRKELCNILNKPYPELTKIEPLEAPKKIIRAEARRGEKIEIPKMNSFSISTTKPEFLKSVKLDRPIYEWGTLKNFKTKFFIFTSIHLPSENERDAEKIIRDFYNYNKREIQSIISMTNTETKLYKIKFEDNDIYNVPGKTESEAITLGKKLHDSKINIITKNMVGVNLDDWEELIKDFNNRYNGSITLKSIKSVSETPETFVKPKEPKQFKLIKTLDKDDTVEYGPYNF